MGGWRFPLSQTYLFYLVEWFRTNRIVGFYIPKLQYEFHVMNFIGVKEVRKMQLEMVVLQSCTPCSRHRIHIHSCTLVHTIPTPDRHCSTIDLTIFPIKRSRCRVNCINLATRDTSIPENSRSYRF